MSPANKVTLKYFSVLLFVFAFALFSVKSSDKKKQNYSFLNNESLRLRDTIPVKGDTAHGKNKIADTLLVSTADTFNLKFSKDSLSGPISYDAEDSSVIDVPSEKIILYGKKARIVYQDNEL